MRYRALFLPAALAPVFLLLVLPWFTRGLYGFDWTDTTYHFQQALNVQQGREIGADFHSHVPGLSFWLEAMVLEITGADFRVHRYLGLIAPAVTFLALAAIFHSLLGDMQFLQRVLWLLALASLAVTSIWGVQLFWSFSPLAAALSVVLATLIYALFQSARQRDGWLLLACAILVLAAQILVKQSHGILNVLMVTCALVAFGLVQGFPAYRVIALGFAVVVGTMVAAALVSSVCCAGCFLDSVVLSGNSLSLKGLDLGDPLGLVVTILGWSSSAHSIIMILMISVVIALVGLTLRSALARDLLLLALLLSPMLLYYLTNMRPLFHYISIALFLCQCYFLWRVLSGALSWRDEARLAKGVATCFASLPIIGSVIAAQLSWAGAGHVRPGLTLPLIALQAVSILFLNGKRLPGYRTPAIALAASVIFSVSLVEPIPRRHEPAAAGLVALQAPEGFREWPVAPRTAEAIATLQEMSATCPGDTLFQMSWMPIAYTLTGRRNVTKYDLPYHDTISLDDARSILATLADTPPGMLIVQPRYRSYTGPFPAIGMRHLYEKIDEVLAKFEFAGLMEDTRNAFEVYCLPRGAGAGAVATSG